jgi:hypothetical protein
MREGSIAAEPSATYEELLFRVEVREKILYLTTHAREMRDSS